MNLFDAPLGSILVHAVNAQGVWGSGIAAQFKKRYPKAFEHYKKQCKHDGMETESDFTIENNQMIVSLFTSENYGLKVDSPEEILINTTIALNTFTGTLKCNEWEDVPIYSNMFNSGLFKVPWKDTEKILKVFVNKYNLDWTVCDPDLDDK